MSQQHPTPAPTGPEIGGGRFVITGGSSLIGSRIARQLLELDAAHVILFDNLSLSNLDHLDDLIADDRVELVRGDILDPDALARAFGGATGVFAIAAYLTLPLGRDPRLGLQVNIEGMLNVYQAAADQEVRRVVMASSISVHGDNLDGLIAEDRPFGSASLSAPFALYALSKLLGEHLGHLYSERHQLECCSVRFSTVYGERQHERGVNALAMIKTWQQIRDGRPPQLVGDGSDAHDYLYVGDAAAGAIAAMRHGRTATAYTIASGTATTTRDVVDLVLEASGSDLAVEQVPDDRDAKPTSHPTLDLDVTRARHELGWRAEVALADGVARLVAWLDAQEPR